MHAKTELDIWIEEREMFDQTEPPCYTPAMTNNNIPPEVTERLNKVLANCPEGWYGEDVHQLESGAWVAQLRTPSGEDAGHIVVMLPKR